jgi:predicted nucleic acid-binding protein
MKAYWDSSALVQACNDPALRGRLRREAGITRAHSLSEVFSAFTGGNMGIRMDADQAAETVANLAADLEFVDLSAQEILGALKEARKRGVRGGRVHDFMHAVAAEKWQAQELLTLDENDFASLVDRVKVQIV